MVFFRPQGLYLFHELYTISQFENVSIFNTFKLFSTYITSPVPHYTWFIIIPLDSISAR